MIKNCKLANSISNNVKLTYIVAFVYLAIAIVEVIAGFFIVNLGNQTFPMFHAVEAGMIAIIVAVILFYLIVRHIEWKRNNLIICAGIAIVIIFFLSFRGLPNDIGLLMLLYSAIALSLFVLGYLIVRFTKRKKQNLLTYVVLLAMLAGMFMMWANFISYVSYTADPSVYVNIDGNYVLFYTYSIFRCSANAEFLLEKSGYIINYNMIFSVIIMITMTIVLIINKINTCIKDCKYMGTSR